MNGERTDLVLPNDDGLRPNGEPDECFYCGQKIGTPHKPECVCLRKTVKVRFVIEFVKEEPTSWTKHDIEFRYNEGSWCGSNVVGILRGLADDLEKHEATNEEGCLCSNVSCEFIEDVDPTPRSKPAEED